MTRWFSGLGIVRDLKLSTLRNSTDATFRQVVEGHAPAVGGSRTGVYAQVSCNEGNPSKTEIESGGTIDLIKASPGSKILFGGAPGFAIMDFGAICTMSGNTCTVLGNLPTGHYNFTAKGNNCDANKAEGIDVNP